MRRDSPIGRVRQCAMRWSRSIGGAAGFALCLASAGTSQASAESVTISATPTALLVWIAADRGYFREQGLQAEVKLFQSGVDTVQSMIAGQADLSTTSDAAFAYQSFTHPELRILGTISSSETSRLIARSDRGIRIAADLRGKRVGVTLGSISEYFFDRYLVLHDLPADTATLINLKPTQIVQSLIEGEIDAALTWEPYIRDAELALKDKAVRLPQQLDQLYYFMLLSKQAWVERHPQSARAVLRALIQAERFATERPFEAKALIRARFGFSQAYIDHLWPLHHLYVSLPQGLLFVLEWKSEWHLRKNPALGSAVPDLLDFVNVAPMRDVRESSIGIVK